MKQGSSEDATPSQNIVDHMYIDATRHCFDAYKAMLDIGVCPEQARTRAATKYVDRVVLVWYTYGVCTGVQSTMQ